LPAERHHQWDRLQRRLPVGIGIEFELAVELGRGLVVQLVGIELGVFGVGLQLGVRVEPPLQLRFAIWVELELLFELQRLLHQQRKLDNHLCG
jgi:hypothetical protein